MIAITALIFLSVGSAIAFPANNVDSSVNWKVVGGQTAAPGQFPFIISLRIGETFHTCGGSLIKKKWVLTAAHCVAGGKPSSYSVVAGTNKLNESGVLTPVSRITVHPDWNPSLITNDLALLELAEPIEESELIQTIDLCCDNDDNAEDCTLIGWGRTSYPGVIPNDLQFLDVVSLPYQQCRDKWQNINPVFPTEICTFTKAGEGACHGDSGGPLITEKNGKKCLTGAVSWGQPCARGMPDVYTRISSFCSWVQNNIKN